LDLYGLPYAGRRNILKPLNYREYFT